MNAPIIGFAVSQLTPAVGGLVTGLNLAGPLSDAVVTRLRAAVAERHVLFFEGQTLDPAAQRDVRLALRQASHPSCLSAYRWRSGDHSDRDAPRRSAGQ